MRLYAVTGYTVHQAMSCTSDAFERANRPELSEVGYHPHFTDAEKQGSKIQ